MINTTTEFEKIKHESSNKRRSFVDLIGGVDKLEETKKMLIRTAINGNKMLRRTFNTRFGIKIDSNSDVDSVYKHLEQFTFRY